MRENNLFGQVYIMLINHDEKIAYNKLNNLLYVVTEKIVSII